MANNGFFNKEDSLSERSPIIEDEGVKYDNDINCFMDKINNHYTTLKIENVSLNVKYKNLIDENKKMIDENNKLNKFIKELKNSLKSI